MRRLVPLLYFCCSFIWGQAQIVINEVMQANLYVYDEYKELPESWVEIYNLGDEAFPLEGYRVLYENEMFEFDSADFVQPHAFFMVYCDEKDAGNHAKFKLKTDKKTTMALLSPSGEVVDEFVIPIMKQAGVSYGRDADDGSQNGWLVSATPLAINSSVGSRFLPKPKLMEESGWFYSDFTVHLDEMKDGVTVRYTLNGSEPTSDSEAMQDSMTLSCSSVLRLRAFSNGCIPSETSTYSFLFPEREITLPLFSITTNQDALYGENFGIFSDKLQADSLRNYEHDWHRCAYVEFFMEDGTKILDQPCELRVMGGTSRNHPQKSLSLYSRKRLSGGDFLCSLWNEKAHIGKVHSFVLRNAGNDFLFAHLRDAAAQSVAGKYLQDIDYQAYQPAIVFINGEYYGLMNIRERTNEDFASSNYGYTDVDVIENWFQVNNGSFDEAEELYDMLSSNTLSYADLIRKVDVTELINYLIVEAYFGNSDYMDNNMVMWRRRSENGRWRWILKDLDMTFDYRFDRTNFDFPVINHFEKYFSENKEDVETDECEEYIFGARMFRNILKQKEFGEEFIDRFSIYMGDFLHPRYLMNYMDSLARRIEYEFPYTFGLYADYRKDDAADWYQEIGIMKNFFSKRQWLNANSMREFFDLGDMYKLVINDPYEKNDSVLLTFNGVGMTHSSFDGYYYKNRRIKIQAVSKCGKRIMGWEVKKDGKHQTSFEHYDGDSLELTIPTESLAEAVYIRVLYEKYEAEELNNPPKWRNEVGGLYIEQLGCDTKVEIFDLMGRLLYENEHRMESEMFIPLALGCYLLQVDDAVCKIMIVK